MSRAIFCVQWRGLGQLDLLSWARFSGKTRLLYIRVKNPGKQKLFQIKYNNDTTKNQKITQTRQEKKIRLKIRRWFLATGAGKSHKVRSRQSKAGFVTQCAGGTEDAKILSGLVHKGKSEVQQPSADDSVVSYSLWCLGEGFLILSRHQDQLQVSPIPLQASHAAYPQLSILKYITERNILPKAFNKAFKYAVLSFVASYLK